MRNATSRLARCARIALTTASISSGAAAAAEAAANPCEPEIVRAAERYHIPIGILYAVGLAETGRRGSLQPNALNIEGNALFPASRSAALAAVEEARRGGAKLIDLGCMQINQHYHRSAFRSLGDMLDPKQNVDYAARFLMTLKGRHDTWSMAVARYHAGPDNNPAQKRYVCRVIANMVATRFGRWTANARSFCNQ
jgi:soluble lytic murein transglycosylase-like protein